MKKTAITVCIFMVITCLSGMVKAQENDMAKTLIVYYSLTGNTKAGCQLLKNELQADALEIKDLVNRAGGWGFARSAIGSLLGLHTKIEPEHPDMSAYQNIIIASPIWTGKLSMAVRTFIDENQFNNKKVILYTTTNAEEKEKYKEKNRNLLREKGGEVVGYFQILAKKEVGGEKVLRTKEEMAADTLSIIPSIKKLITVESN